MRTPSINAELRNKALTEVSNSFLATPLFMLSVSTIVARLAACMYSQVSGRGHVQVSGRGHVQGLGNAGELPTQKI